MTKVNRLPQKANRTLTCKTSLAGKLKLHLLANCTYLQGSILRRGDITCGIFTYPYSAAIKLAL